MIEEERIVCRMLGIDVNEREVKHIEDDEDDSDLVVQTKPGRYLVFGEELSSKEISLKYNINQNTVLTRIRQGCTSNQLIKKAELKKYEIEGKVMTIKDIAKKYNINETRLRGRLNQGYSIEDSVKMGNNRIVKRYKVRGKMMSVAEMSEMCGHSQNVIRSRMHLHPDEPDLWVADRIR